MGAPALGQDQSHACFHTRTGPARPPGHHMDEQQQGPFDRILQSEPQPQRDRAATFIVAAAIILGALLLLLVLPPISILDDGDGALAGPVTTTRSDESPPPPDGFEAVSPLYEFSVSQGARGESISVLPLSTPVGPGDRLVLYSYVGGGWRQVGEAEALSEKLARPDLSFLPENVAVFRAASSQARQVLGSLPNGAELDPRAPEMLTALNVTGFSPAADGGVAGGPLQLPPDLTVAVAPTVGALAPEEVAALNDVLVSPELRSAHVQALLNFARDNNVAGIDLDYRALDPARGGDFAALVQGLAAGLHQEGRTLSLTLPLPILQGEAWDTRGFDWQALSAQADLIKLAAEPERTYQQVDDALAYLVAQVGGGKLLLTVGPLSREQGTDGLRTLRLSEALALASVAIAPSEAPITPGVTVRATAQNLAPELGATGMHWDDAARAIVFRYTGLGGERTVWIANVFSEAFKLDLARRYQLAGVAVEDVSNAPGEADILPIVHWFAQTGTVSLVEPNGELLTPRWVASGGTFASDAGAQVEWRAPDEPGDYTLTLVVSDGVTRMGQELRVSVQQPSAVSP